MNGLLNRILAFDSNSQPILVDTKRSLNPLEISRAIARCRHVIHHDLSGQRLAIIGTSSVDFFVWLLAAWAEGRSVIPVDESLPAERRDLLLRYADAGMVTDIPMEGETRNAPSHDRDNADEAMVLFTSGSTGQPQGWSSSAGALLADRDADRGEESPRRPEACHLTTLMKVTAQPRAFSRGPKP